MEMVFILILNWNGWKDTIECLESVFRLNYPNFRVILCDNNSQDGSLEQIKKWAKGEFVQLNDTLFIELFEIPLLKPISFVEYNRLEAESGGNIFDQSSLVFIQTGANLGFAGGNNVGIRYALARNDFDYIWLLNNDTVVVPDTLSQLVKRMEENKNIGFCGSSIRFYDESDKLQTLGGGVYNPWFGISKHIATQQKVSVHVCHQKIERRLSYISGASMLVSKGVLKDVGLMSEDYFLYYEEIDWATRAKGKYKLGFVPESIVYHKEGRSIGSNNDPQKRSILAEYYGIKNRIVFTKRYFSWALPSVYSGLLITLGKRLLYRQWDRVLLILKIIFQKP